MSANKDGAISMLWHLVTGLRLERKRFKHTLALSFSRPSFSNGINYPAEYASGEISRAGEGIHSGSIPKLMLPPEFTTAIKYFAAYKDSSYWQYVRTMGVPDYRLMCAVCGKSTVFDQEGGDDLKDSFEECKCSFSAIAAN